MEPGELRPDPSAEATSSWPLQWHAEMPDKTRKKFLVHCGRRTLTPRKAVAAALGSHFPPLLAEGPAKPKRPPQLGFARPRCLRPTP